MITLIDYWREHAIEQILAVAGRSLRNPGEYREFLGRMSNDELRAEFKATLADYDARTEPYTVIGPNYIKVCADCFPGDKIVQYFPDLAGCKISHGICPGHARRVMNDAKIIMALRKQRKEAVAA